MATNMKKLMLFIVLLIIFTGCTRQNLELDMDMEGSNDEDTVEIKPIVPEEKDETVEVDKEVVQGPYRPVGVMIENSPDARPQSGLIDADVVYEVYVEGGITRFLALFMSKYPEVAGPVRSVRHYYLDIVQEWDALLVHYGGSGLAKEQFPKRPIKRIDGMEGSKLYWRDNSRVAPHNAYIDITQCEKLIDYDQKRREIKVSKEKPIIGIEYNTINIPFNSTFSNLQYTYDRETGKNMRGNNGKPSINKENGEQLFADNIVVQYAEHERMDSGVGYKKVDLVGSGSALYFIGGKYFEGKWERASLEEPTLFLDESGEEVGFMEGNLWIHIVPNSMKVVVE